MQISMQSCVSGGHCSLGSSVPDLLQEVAGRLVSVEEGLAALDNHKTALHNNADKVNKTTRCSTCTVQVALSSSGSMYCSAKSGGIG